MGSSGVPRAVILVRVKHTLSYYMNITAVTSKVAQPTVGHNHELTYVSA
jgi:hypothetical protein